MFPLKERKIGGYKFGQPTTYNAHHIGTDFVADYDELYAPFNGVILKELNGTEGGLTIWFKPDGQDVIMRFMHLSQFIADEGEKVTEGQLIAITGSSGRLSSGPHLHLDLSNHNVDINNFSNFRDPEKYNWGQEEPMFSADRNMIVGVLKTFLTYWYSKLYNQPKPDGEVTKIAENIADNNINLTNWLETEIKTDYFKYFVRRSELETLNNELLKLKAELDKYTSEMKVMVYDLDNCRTTLSTKPVVVEEEDITISDALKILIQAIKNSL